MSNVLATARPLGFDTLGAAIALYVPGNAATAPRYSTTGAALSSPTIGAALRHPTPTTAPSTQPPGPCRHTGGAGTSCTPAGRPNPGAVIRRGGAQGEPTATLSGAPTGPPPAIFISQDHRARLQEALRDFAKKVTITPKGGITDMRYKLAVIGVGRPWKTEGATGFGMAHAHVTGFTKTERCDLVAIADISRENAEAFAAQYGGPRIHMDYAEMLAAEKPDIVSICTWPHLHCPMTLAAAEAGVRAIHCEKPMAPTWGEAKRMHETCIARGVQLTFNHQRRFLEPFQTAREMVRSGAIGTLRRLESQCGDLFDWGTHWLDMMFFFNEETPAEWVVGQIDARTTRKVFGVPLEQQGLCHFKFANGVRATLYTGFETDIGCANRLIGDDGIIEIGWGDPVLRMSRWDGRGTEIVPVSEGIHDSAAHARVAADIVHCLDTGDRPLLSSHNAIRSTEVIFATYESSRRRGRVDLPLDTEDSALLAMLAQGLIGSEATG